MKTTRNRQEINKHNKHYIMRVSERASEWWILLRIVQSKTNKRIRARAKWPCYGNYSSQSMDTRARKRFYFNFWIANLPMWLSSMCWMSSTRLLNSKPHLLNLQIFSRKTAMINYLFIFKSNYYSRSLARIFDVDFWLLNELIQDAHTL